MNCDVGCCVHVCVEGVGGPGVGARIFSWRQNVNFITLFIHCYVIDV